MKQTKTYCGINKTMKIQIRKTLIAIALCFGSVMSAQNASPADTTAKVAEKRVSEAKSFKPEIHGILRGKYEFQPALKAGRFEVRNARMSISGNLPLRSAYKLEVDLCDESVIKMKDAWVRLNPVSSLRITIGQQRMPFSIDAHRNPSAQYFANRSFVAKQVGDMRDVGLTVGYDLKNRNNRKVLSIDAGIYNGSNLDNQKSAWFKAPSYSARLQYFPIESLAIVPSVQHQKIAGRKAQYTSVNIGAYFEKQGFHAEAEYMRKIYGHDAFTPCNAADVMLIYRQKLKRDDRFLTHLSYLLRYDYMDDHADGKQGFEDEAETRLKRSDAARHRVTAGLTLSVNNRYFPTAIRFNYEKYFYPNDGSPKESEQDKLVAELMIRF